MDKAAFAQFNIQIGNELTWNVQPLLHEIRHALQALLNSNTATIIDLRSIPLAPGEEESLLNTLGRGEVSAQLAALGLSEIVETRYQGVWVVTHFNTENNIIGRFIEITRMPEILRAQDEDITVALAHLEAALVTGNDSTTNHDRWEVKQ